MYFYYVKICFFSEICKCFIVYLTYFFLNFVNTKIQKVNH